MRAPRRSCRSREASRRRAQESRTGARRRQAPDGARRRRSGAGAASNGEAIRSIGGVKLLARAVEGIDAKDLKSLVDDAKKSIGSGIVVIASASPDGKAGVVVGVTDDLTQKYSAVDFVRVASAALGGKGGGGRSRHGAGARRASAPSSR
ncbi:DHHA1 domain-containing protein [Methylocystis parvus]|uniref:DHHA1 domain-containing protein n=1 Tax=Methylocystis parvus TaxID=134 RepID=UPI003C70B272